MNMPARSLRQTVRYFLFPTSRMLDERTKELDKYEESRRLIKEATGKIVEGADRADVLRNLVVAMQSKQVNGG